MSARLSSLHMFRDRILVDGCPSNPGNDCGPAHAGDARSKMGSEKTGNNHAHKLISTPVSYFYAHFSGLLLLLHAL